MRRGDRLFPPIDSSVETLAPRRISGRRAALGDALRWNGRAYAPAAVSGAAAGYATQRTATSSGNITDADRNGVVYALGEGIVLTLVRSGWSARDRVTVINLSAAHAVEVSAGTDGINEADNDEMLIPPGEAREFVYEGTADPYWRSASPQFVALGPNQFLAVGPDGQTPEARTDSGFADIPIQEADDDGTYAVIFRWGQRPGRLTRISASTLGGTCSIVMRKGASDVIPEYSDPIAITTSNTHTNVAAHANTAMAENDTLSVVVSSASALTGLVITLNYEWTA